MDILTEKLQPENIDLEESVLSSLLIGVESIDDVFLKPEDFYSPANAEIFKTMLHLQSKNIDIDLLSVSNKLKEADKIKFIGGFSYLSKLIDCPASVNLGHFTGKIKESANLRKLITISSKIVSNCYDKGKKPVDIIEHAQRDISSIGVETTGETDIKDILNTTYDKLEALRNNDGMLSGLPTGLARFDGHTSGLQDSDLILLGARPSMGKTSLCMNIVQHAAFNFYPTLVFSLEMSKEKITHRLLSEIAGVDGMKFTSGKFSEQEWEKVKKATDRLFEMPVHIVDTSGLSINEITSISRSFKRKHKIKLIVLDYIQLIYGWDDPGQGPKAQITKGMKAIAKTLDIPVIALSQLNRSLEKRENKRPILSDLRESGALEQDADLIAFLYRHEVYENEAEKLAGINKGKAELLLRKNRNGSIGKIDLTFIPEFTKFVTAENY